MALIEWNPAYSVKVKLMDEQHKKLIELINQLHDAMKAGEGNSMLGIILQSLVAYTRNHFAEEEKMMQVHAYSGFAKQKASHEAFVAKVMDLQQKFQTGSTMLSMTVLSFLKDWLVNHIQGEDQKYAAHFNSKGIF